MRGVLFLVAGLVYVIACRASLMVPQRLARGVAFALVNVVAFAYVAYAGLPQKQTMIFTAAYVSFALAHFVLIRAAATRSGLLSQAAILFPIAALIAVRVIPRYVTAPPMALVPVCFVGISYLSFRLSHLALEVRNRTVARPSVGEYLAFAFFAPLSSVGPIQPFSGFIRGFTSPLPLRDIAVTAVTRIVVGATKFVFLGNLANTLSYTGLLLDGNRHHAIDLPVAVVAYYVYLYLNFSGFCDVVIGLSALAGIGIEENFDQPFRARNVREFWTRWHITLSVYLRDTVFTPLSKILIRAAGPAWANHCVAVAIVVVFLLVGLFHGFAWNFFLFGAAHALGVVVNHYYDILLKQRLGRDAYRRYHASVAIRVAAQAATFVFVAASFLLFANTIETIRQIAEALK